jgi:hypothetical protein
VAEVRPIRALCERVTKFATAFIVSADFQMKTLILLIPTNVVIADDHDDDGFQKVIAAGLVMDDSPSSKIIDYSPMVNPIKIAECEARRVLTRYEVRVDEHVFNS